jgi:hypothetical protein
MKNTWSILLCAASLTALGCTVNSEGALSDESTEERSDALLTATFSGTVTNDQGVAIAGATVAINGINRTTDATGKYSASVLASSSGYRISIAKAGFAPATEFHSAGSSKLVHALKPAYVQQINPTQDNTVVSNTGASVNIKANSLVDASGVAVTAPVNITIATYDPLRMPGDFTAVNTASQQVALESVGAVSVAATLVSNGAALRLKPGATASAFIPVPSEVGAMPSCVSSGTCRLAMWRFDPASGKWQERPANLKFTASGTSFTMTGSNVVNSPLDTGLGIWNADIEKKAPACTIIQLGLPQECYGGAGLQLKARLPNSSAVLISETTTVTDPSQGFVALYNISPNAIHEVGIAFPKDAPPECASNLVIDAGPQQVASYPVLSDTGGVTRFNSGPSWGGTGFPTKPGTNDLITKQNVADSFNNPDQPPQHPCGSYVQFLTTLDPAKPPRKAMTWSLLDSAKPNASSAYALPGTDGVTNPYQGDTWTNNTLPILCINKNNASYPGGGVIGSPVQTPGGAWRRTWSGGTVALSDPVRGTSLDSKATADALCSGQFGAGYRMAEFHDGDPTLWSGWDFWGAALNADLTPFKGTRFWVSINDQNANPW